MRLVMPAGRARASSTSLAAMLTFASRTRPVASTTAERSSASRFALTVSGPGPTGYVSGWPGIYTGIETHSCPSCLIYLRPLLLSVLN
jgi:hypothetical protein